MSDVSVWSLWSQQCNEVTVGFSNSWNLHDTMGTINRKQVAFNHVPLLWLLYLLGVVIRHLFLISDHVEWCGLRLPLLDLDLSALAHDAGLSSERIVVVTVVGEMRGCSFLETYISVPTSQRGKQAAVEVIVTQSWLSGNTWSVICEIRSIIVLHSYLSWIVAT